MAEETGIERFIRPDLAAFVGYSASTSPETLKGKISVPLENVVKLDANENPYGCSTRVNQALANYAYFNVYPDNGQETLRRLLAGYVGLGSEYIVAGSGADQLIDLVVRLFGGLGSEVIICVPAFEMYGFFARLSGSTVIEIPRDEGFAVDIAAVKAAVSDKTRLIVLANPNNPTGVLTPRQDILELVDTGLPVVIDEAYYEFSGETVASLVAKYDNLMVLRTFSKWAGLAGLRVGYGIYPPRIAEYMLNIEPPYSVNAAALVAVAESLKDIDFLMSGVKAVVAERGRLLAELGNTGWLKPLPSQANFILCLVPGGGAKRLHEKLRDRGILVRYFDKPLLKDYIRISVGKPEHTDALMKALKEIEEETGG